MRKDNPFKKEDFASLIDYKQKLSNPDINNNDRERIENKIKDIYKQLSKENTFFSNIENFDSIIANAHFNNELFRYFHLLLFHF